MKKIIAFLLLLLLTGGGLQAIQAEPITEQQARERAAAFLHQNHQRRAVRAVAGTVINDEPVLAYSEPQGSFFVYNAADKATGFVIIAGTSLLDDPVLGYTEQGAFDANNIPCNFKWYLENAANYIQALETGLVTAPVTNAPYMASRSNVSPFLTSKWDQISPYNAKIPDGCVTGCVATAFAQVLYYYKSPTSTQKAIPSWTDPSGHTGPAVPKGTALNLSSCKDTYSYGETSTAATAVANLMLYCGTAVRMKWGPGLSSSGEYEAATSLVEYFGYSTLIRDYSWDSSIFTQEQWIDLIYTEVAAKRPVMFSGGSGSSGHVFLCDGYQKSDNKFHINWGWSGTDDGYYSLFNFNPPHGSNYSGWNSAVIGIQPKQSSDPSCPPLSVLMPVKIENSGYVEDFTEHVITRSSTSSSFTSSKGFYYAPGLLAVYDTFGSFSYDIAFGIYNQSGTLLETYGATNNYKTFTGQSRDGGGISYNWYGKPITISSSISNGTYYIYPVCKKNGTTKWYPMLQAAWYNLKVVINGTKATVTQGSYTGFEGYSSSGGTTTDTTAPTLGSISTSNITSSSVKLSWSAASDNVTTAANLQYQVQYKTSSGSWTTAKAYTKALTSFEVTGLAASTTYTFRVTVKDEAGNTAYKEVSATTSAAADTTAPTLGSISTSNITSSSVKLSWSAASDNVTTAANLQYQVQYKTSSGSWTTAKAYTKALTSFEVTGLAASTTYTFRVTVKDEAGNTAYKEVSAKTSAAADTTAPTLGSISTSNITSSSVKLTWSASDNVTTAANLQYQVQYKKSSASSWTTAKSYTKALTSFEVTGLAASTTYTFRVTVKDEAGNTAYKDVNATTTSAGDTEAPKINSLTTSDITSSSVKLTWSVTDNVTSTSNIKYFVDYRLSGGSESDWQNATSSWKTGIDNFTVTGLAASTAYEVRLLAKDEAGNTALKIVTVTTKAASTTTDYGVTIAGTKLTSDVVKPGETKTITNSYITGSVKASVNSAGNKVTITLYNATIKTPSTLNAVLRCEDGLPVTLDVNGTNTFEAEYGSGIMVKNTSILITGNGTLNLSGPWYSIFTYTGGTAEIQGNVKLYCNGDIAGNGYGTSEETLIIGGHAYVNVITGNVERLQRLNLLDNIDLLYPYRTTAIISHQYEQYGSHDDMGLAVVKSFPSGGDVGTVGELYTGGGIVFGERYGMGIGSKRVDAYNAADILGNGQFSFDASKNELTMNNATLEIGQEFNLDQGYYNMEVINVWNENPITIKLVGNNTISSKSNGIPVLRQKDTNPKIIFTGTGSLECKAGGSWGNNEGEVFYISNSVEFNGPEVSTWSGMSAIKGLSSTAKVIVSKGKLALNAWWGSFSSDPSVEPDGPVLIQSLAGLTLNNGLVIVNPKGGYFSSSLGTITKNGSTQYKGSVLIGDASLGIESISNDPSAINRYYTLDGRAINGTPRKGVYIMNGKKVVIK